MSAMAKLARHWDAGRMLCVGLDPDPSRLPVTMGTDAAAVVRFCDGIIAATADLVCAYKPNAAFFEALGPAGVQALAQVCAAARRLAPEAVLIYDAKRGDIGSTNLGYAQALDALGADAVTLNPYCGGAALAPFLDRASTLCFVLCRTSNPGGGELQDLELADGERLYECVARALTGWNTHGNVGAVVGATMPAELARVRSIVGPMPILVPGIGAQGGDLRATLAAGQDASGRGLVISVSRAILYASRDSDFADAARRAALALQAEIGRAHDPAA